MLKIPRFHRRLTIINIVFGVFLFAWMSAENTIWLVAVFGIGLSLLLVVHGVLRFGGRTLPPRVWFPGVIMLGSLIGAGASAATAFLMLMKNALHGQLFPDYSFALIGAMLARLPAWTVAGALVGLALALILYGRRRGEPDGSPGFS